MKILITCLFALGLIAGCAGHADRTVSSEQRSGYGAEQQEPGRAYDSLTPRRTRSDERPGEWNVRPPMDSNN
jgi:hypothetical protein